MTTRGSLIGFCPWRVNLIANFSKRTKKGTKTCAQCWASINMDSNLRGLLHLINRGNVQVFSATQLAANHPRSFQILRQVLSMPPNKWTTIISLLALLKVTTFKKGNCLRVKEAVRLLRDRTTQIICLVNLMDLTPLTKSSNEPRPLKIQQPR